MTPTSISTYSSHTYPIAGTAEKVRLVNPQLMDSVPLCVTSAILCELLSDQPGKRPARMKSGQRTARTVAGSPQSGRSFSRSSGTGSLPCSRM